MSSSYRITVPEDHVAVILSKELSQELLSLLTLMRGKARRLELTPQVRAIAGDVLLAFIDNAPAEGVHAVLNQKPRQ